MTDYDFELFTIESKITKHIFSTYIPDIQWVNTLIELIQEKKDCESKAGRNAPSEVRGIK